MNFKFDSDKAYYMTIFIVALQDTLNGSSLFNPLYRHVKILFTAGILLLGMFQIVCMKLKRGRFFFFLISILLAAYSSYCIGNNYLLYIVLLSNLSFEKDMKKTAKIVLTVTGTCFLIHFFVFLICYIVWPSRVDVLDWMGIQRYYLFYDHPNNATRIFVFLLLLIVYLYHQKITLIHWCIALAFCISIYQFTRSDAIILVGIIFIFWFGERYFCKSNIIISIIAKYGMIIFAFISIISIASYKIPMLNKIFGFIDQYASGRFSNFYKTIDLYGISLLGQPTIFGYDIGVYADNLTIYFITSMGGLYLVLLCLLFIKASKEMKWAEKLCLSIFSIYGLIENRIFTIETYFVIMLAFNVLSRHYISKYKQYTKQ